MLRLFTGDRGGSIMLALLGIACVVVPVFNLLVPESSWFHLSTYTVTVWGKYLTYALLAIALDLIWGYCGILSLGHSAFFSLGGYAMGMYLMRQIGPRGVYGHPVLPDFMVFLNWQELPWYWYGSDQFWFALSMVVVVPGLLAFVFGWLALALGYLACRAIVNCKLGRVVVAIRDAEDRARCLGYKVELFKLWVFVFSAVLAGIAGALYVPQVGIINPSEFSPLNSIEIVIWVSVGGRATLYGAVLGAIMVNYAKSYLTVALPGVWLFALGGLFVLVTLFLPRGVVGLLRWGK